MNKLNQTLKAGAFALALMIFQFLAAYVIAAFGIDNPMIEMAITYVIAFGIPCIIYLKITKSNAKNTLFLNPMNIFNVILVILLSFAVQPLLYLMSGVSALIFPNQVSEQMMTYTNMGIIPLIICLAVLPAFFEEICYRGIIFSGYGNVSIKKAAIVCGFLFAIAHLTAQQFLYSFVMGIIFCLMVYYTKSIYSSLLCHFIINALQVISLKATANIPAQAITISDIASLGVITLSTLPILALLFFAFIKINSVHQHLLFVSNENILQHNPDKRFEEKAITWPVIILTVFYILITLVAPVI